jgi:endonuclease I
MFKRQLISITLFSFLCIYLPAQIPANYYDKAIGKQSAELKTALHEIINPHTFLEYYSSATSFRTTDWHPDGYYWDMYSNNKRKDWNNGYTYLNREHSMPKSWFGVSSDEVNDYPIATDLYNLYPSDVTANEAKSNNALGVVGANIYFSNGVVKVGKNTYQGYNGTVFEPANEYKGDFARGYMYMVTSYENYANTWQSTGTSSMLQRNTYPVFNTYAVNLLMEWHRVDPVSSKEINRNNAVYRLQNNRNPFVDHPLLAEYLWGKFVGEAWDGTGDEPETNSPLIYKYNADNNTVFVQLKKPAEATFAIYYLSGKLKQTGKVDAGSQILLRDTNTQHNYEKGVYILSVYAGGFRKTVKLLVY